MTSLLLFWENLSFALSFHYHIPFIFVFIYILFSQRESRGQRLILSFTYLFPIQHLSMISFLFLSFYICNRIGVGERYEREGVSKEVSYIYQISIFDSIRESFSEGLNGFENQCLIYLIWFTNGFCTLLNRRTAGTLLSTVYAFPILGLRFVAWHERLIDTRR